MAALLASSMERFDLDHPAEDGFAMARVTVDILRPVPMERFDVAVEIVKGGRRAQRIRARVEIEGVVFATATGLRVNTQALAVPRFEPESMPPTPDDQWELPEFLRPGSRWQESSGHTDPWVNFVDALELRVVRGSWDGLGPCTAWGRLTTPLVEGTLPTPLERAMVLADFASGCGKTLPFEKFTFPNADLTVSLYRQPDGDWIALDSLMRGGTGGVAVADAQLLDLGGPIGRVTQSCVVSER